MTWNHVYLSLVRARSLFSKVTVSGGELLRRHIAFTPVDHSDSIPLYFQIIYVVNMLE